MELISRKAVLDGIDKYIEKAQSTGTKDDFISFAELGVKALPSAFEGKTNGEVLISLYPDLKYTIRNGRVITTIGVASSFDLDWWNTPYKGVSE